MNRRRKSDTKSRFIAKNRQNNRKKSAIYRDSTHNYRFDEPRLIANFLAISRTWDSLEIQNVWKILIPTKRAWILPYYDFEKILVKYSLVTLFQKWSYCSLNKGWVDLSLEDKSSSHLNTDIFWYLTRRSIKVKGYIKLSPKDMSSHPTREISDTMSTYRFHPSDMSTYLQRISRVI